NGKIAIRLAPAKGSENKALCEAILKQVDTVEAEIYRDTTAILIKDLDHEVNAEEIKAAISKALYGDNKIVDFIDINGLKKSVPGRALTAIAVLPAADAAKILDKKRIRIGWNMCRVNENLVPTRCYNCQGYGHTSKELKKETHRIATTRKWKWKFDKKEALQKILIQKLSGNSTDNWRMVTSIIEDACNRELKQIKSNNKFQQVHWWNSDIAEARKNCIAARRAMNRANKNRTRSTEESRVKYKETRKKLKKEIQKAKGMAWDKLVNDIERDIWGLGYKIVVGKLKKDLVAITEETTTALKKLFPVVPEIKWTKNNSTQEQSFTLEEIHAAAGKLNTGKAPGDDGILPEVVIAAVEAIPEIILAVMNKLIKDREFPKAWKTSKLVLIPKSNNKGEERKFRPICLTSCMGKLFEILIRDRIQKHAEENRLISDFQYGFRTGKSTKDAVKEVWSFAKLANEGSYGRKDYCALVALDIENAFNTARWNKIVEAMVRKGFDPYLVEIVQAYLQDRWVKTDNGKCIQMTCGIPQSSVLGPILWNIMYDAVLEIEMPVGVKMIAFADDLAVLTLGRTEEQLMDTTNKALGKAQMSLLLEPQPGPSWLETTPSQKEQMTEVLLQCDVIEPPLEPFAWADSTPLEMTKVVLQ
ncbi:Putative 115 kDa protein in type-1 retrotransposable element R1DM-like protein, partial [Tribolium castaneum]